MWNCCQVFLISARIALSTVSQERLIICKLFCGKENKQGGGVARSFVTGTSQSHSFTVKGGWVERPSCAKVCLPTPHPLLLCADGGLSSAKGKGNWHRIPRIQGWRRQRGESHDDGMESFVEPQDIAVHRISPALRKECEPHRVRESRVTTNSECGAGAVRRSPFVGVR